VADGLGIWSAAVADGLGIGSSLDTGLLSHGLSPSSPSDRLVLPQGVNPNTRHGAGQLQSPFEAGQPGMASPGRPCGGSCKPGSALQHTLLQ